MRNFQLEEIKWRQCYRECLRVKIAMRKCLICLIKMFNKFWAGK